MRPRLLSHCQPSESTSGDIVGPSNLSAADAICSARSVLDASPRGVAYLMYNQVPSSLRQAPFWSLHVAIFSGTEVTAVMCGRWGEEADD